MSHPLVVHCMKQPCDVYVGRWNPKVPHRSIWHNPFRDGTREENIFRFKEYLLSNPELVAKLPELKGKVLGCWCSPKDCHGDVLAEMANSE